MMPTNHELQTALEWATRKTLEIDKENLHLRSLLARVKVAIKNSIPGDEVYTLKQVTGLLWPKPDAE